MSAGTIETYPIGIRGYQLAPKPAEVEPYRRAEDKADVVRCFVAQPAGLPHKFFMATEADAEQCLAGVKEALG